MHTITETCDFLAYLALDVQQNVALRKVSALDLLHLSCVSKSVIGWKFASFTAVLDIGLP